LRKIFLAQGTPAAAKNPPEDPPDGDGGDDWAMTQRCLAAVLANMPMCRSIRRRTPLPGGVGITTDEAERGGRNVNGHGRTPIFSGTRADERGNLRPVNVDKIEVVKHAKHATKSGDGAGLPAVVSGCSPTTRLPARAAVSPASGSFPIGMTYSAAGVSSRSSESYSTSRRFPTRTVSSFFSAINFQTVVFPSPLILRVIGIVTAIGF
jgi:hypothetical protein